MSKGAHSILGKLQLGLVRLLHDRRGQDLIEYAMLAAFMAIATAAIMPTNIQTLTSTIFSRVNGSLVTASGS